MVTVSGRLWQASTAPGAKPSRSTHWTPYAGRSIEICFTTDGRTFAFNTDPKTDSSGRFSGLFALPYTASWFAQYVRDKTHFASTSSHIKITVSDSHVLPLALSSSIRDW